MTPAGESAPATRRAGTSARRVVSIYNIANAVTLLRLAMVPLFAVVLLLEEGQNDRLRTLAAAIFAVAAVTDLVDGELARRWSLVTDLGKVADPIADKALIGAALVGLSLLAELPWWVTVVVLARELAVTVLRFWVLRHGVIPASRGGKAKTLLQAVGLGLYLLPLDGIWRDLAGAVVAVAVVVTVVTGVDYVRQALILRRSDAASPAGADR